MSNFDFTDKAQQCLAAAVQLAKDYANAQGMSLSSPLREISDNFHAFSLVHPVHLASVLINEGSGDISNGKASGSSSLFSSVIQKAGGDQVSRV